MDLNMKLHKDPNKDLYMDLYKDLYMDLLYLHYHLTGGIDSQKTLEYLIDMPPEDRQNVAYKHYFGESITGI